MYHWAPWKTWSSDHHLPLQDANDCVHPRLWWGGGEACSLFPQHPMQTHVPAIVTCTVTSLHGTTAPLGGYNDPVTRNYGSNGNRAKSMGTHSPRGDLKTACRKGNWDFWNFWLSLQQSVGPWTYHNLVFLITSLLGFKSLPQRHADNPILKREGKRVIQNQALEERVQNYSVMLF